MQQELTAQSREWCDPRTPKSQWHIINWGIWEPQEQIPVPGQRGTHLQTDCANKMLFKCLESQVDGCFYKALKLPRHRKEQPKPWHCSCSDSSLPRAFMESLGILRRVPGQLLDSLCFCWSCGWWQILLKVLTIAWCSTAPGRLCWAVLSDPAAGISLIWGIFLIFIAHSIAWGYTTITMLIINSLTSLSVSLWNLKWALTLWFLLVMRCTMQS